MLRYEVASHFRESLRRPLLREELGRRLDDYIPGIRSQPEFKQLILDRSLQFWSRDYTQRWNLCFRQSQSTQPFHLILHGVPLRTAGRSRGHVQLMCVGEGVAKAFQAHPMAAATERGKPRAGRTAMQIDAAVKPCRLDGSERGSSRKKASSCAGSVVDRDDLIDIWIMPQHLAVRRFHKDRDAKIGPPGLQGRIERCGEDGVSQRAQANKQNAGAWRKARKQVGMRHA